jgi:sec-independent protein translocase protein TatA
MGDVAKGLKSFKKGMAEDDEAVAQRRIESDRLRDLPPERPIDRTIDASADRARDLDGPARREP